MKDSGIDWLGQIPADWEVKRLKQLVREGSSISYGVVQPGPHQDDGVPFIQTTDLVRGHLSLDDLQRTTEEIAAQYPRSRLAAGDVLLGIRASVGDTCVVTSELDGVNLSRGIARVVPGPSVIADFLSLCLKSDYVYSYWMLAQQGSTFREVSIASVKELPLAVPPMVEQAAILASVFKKTNHVERATQLTASIIDLLQEYRSALITNAVTGKIDVRGKVEKEAAA
jgi:type I restriction enzyme S subunit